MFATKPELVCELRSMAANGSKPSDLLRLILSHHPDDPLARHLFYQYFTEAFCFSEGEASPLYGWLPDGTGELKDANIDYLMTRRIQKNRSAWEPAPRSLS